MDVEDMNDGSSKTQIVVHEVVDEDPNTEYVCAIYDGEGGDHYNTAMEQILAQFRCQAQAMMSAQIQLHNRQTVNHDQATLDDSHAQSANATQGMVAAHAMDTKHDIEHRVQLALEDASKSTITIVQELAKSTVDDYAKNTHDQLETNLQAAWKTTHTDETTYLQRQLSAFLDGAQNYINKAIVLFKTAEESSIVAKSAPNIMAELQEQLEKRIQLALQHVPEQTNAIVLAAEPRLASRL